MLRYWIISVLRTSQQKATRILIFNDRARLILQGRTSDSLDEATTTLNDIGFVFQSKGELDRALNFYHHVLSIIHKHGPHRLDEAATLYN